MLCEVHFPKVIPVFLRVLCWSSLSSERAAASPSESAVIVTSFVECLRYSIMQNAGDEQSQDKIRNMLISQQVWSCCHAKFSQHFLPLRCFLKCFALFLQLLPLIEKAVRSPSLQNGPLFLLITEMLISWEKRAGLRSEGEENNNKDVFKRLLVDFWEELCLLCVRFVDDEDVDLQALEGVATLLQVSLLLCFSKMCQVKYNGSKS